MDRQCGPGYKYCCGRKLEICSHEQGKLADLSLKGQGSLCAVVPMMMLMRVFESGTLHINA
jgi:hypothetical protein